MMRMLGKMMLVKMTLVKMLLGKMMMVKMMMPDDDHKYADDDVSPPVLSGLVSVAC